MLSDAGTTHARRCSPRDDGVSRADAHDRVRTGTGTGTGTRAHVHARARTRNDLRRTGLRPPRSPGTAKLTIPWSPSPLDRWGSALTNYQPSVKADARLPLGASVAAWASYVNRFKKIPAAVLGLLRLTTLAMGAE